MSKVPVTIVMGFLGAGKTTLLKHLLNNKLGLRIAVIENEFGDEIGIERLVAKDVQGENTDLDDLFVEMSNGCICCAVRDDLVTTIEFLLKKKARFDHIVIETSGLANPGPLASNFWLDEELESELVLDAIVTVVDAKNIHRHLLSQEARNKEAHMQVAYADVLLVNKADILEGEQQKQALEHTLRGINALAQISFTSYASIPVEEVLNIHAFDAQHTQIPASVQETHVHDAVSSVCVTCVRPLDLTKFRTFIAELLWEPTTSENLFRVKGVLVLQGQACVSVLQAVHETFEISPTKAVCEEGQSSKVVFIGKHLDREAIETGVWRCMV